jgi:hypothetical protein
MFPSKLSNSGYGEVSSPPDSRRASGEDRDQRLPSLSEALGADQRFQYTTPPSTATSTSVAIPPPLVSPTGSMIRQSENEPFHPSLSSHRSMSEGTLSFNSQGLPPPPLHPDFPKPSATRPPQFSLPSFSAINAPKPLPTAHQDQHMSDAGSQQSSIGIYQQHAERPSLPFHTHMSSSLNEPTPSPKFDHSGQDSGVGWDSSRRVQPGKRRMENFDILSYLQIVSHSEGLLFVIHHLIGM